MDDPGAKGSAQGKDSVADEQGASRGRKAAGRIGASVIRRVADNAPWPRGLVAGQYASRLRPTGTAAKCQEPNVGQLFDELVGAARATSALRVGVHLLAASSKCFNASAFVASVSDLQTYVGLKMASSFCLL